MAYSNASSFIRDHLLPFTLLIRFRSSILLQFVTLPSVSIKVSIKRISRNSREQLDRSKSARNSFHRASNTRTNTIVPKLLRSVLFYCCVATPRIAQIYPAQFFISYHKFPTDSVISHAWYFDVSFPVDIYI